MQTRLRGRFAQHRDEIGRLVRRARDQHAFAEERSRLPPREFLTQPHDVAHDDHRGRRQLRFAHARGQLRERRLDDALARRPAFHHDGGRRRRRATVRQ